MTVLGLRASDAPALVDTADGTETSYRQLVERGETVDAYLGPEKNLVFIACRNDIFTTSIYVGALEAGHAVALVEGSGSSTSHVDLIERYRPGWLAGPSGHGEMWRNAGLPIRRVHELFGGDLVELENAAKPTLHPDLAVLLMTSGTTGSMQAVRLSGGNIRANARSIAEMLGLRPTERPITSLPLHYSFGLSVLNSHLTAGASIALSTTSVMQRSFWDSVERFACSSLAGVPYTYQMLERIGYRDMRLPSLMTMQQAGGALDETLTATYAQHMAEKGGRLYVMYGQTEATARMAYVPAEQLKHKLGSAGIPIPGGSFRVRGVDGSSETAGLVGEIVYEGPNVMLGYATGADDLGKGDECDGTLSTGDLGRIDEDGYLYLVGRSKRIAKVFGVRINLDEVESMLGGHGPVAVVGGMDTIWAFGTFDDVVLETVERDVADWLHLHPRAVRVRRVEELPTFGSGKIDYGTVGRWIPS